jgi:hypothetical protein
MIFEKDLLQRLNLLRTSKKFVFKEIGKDGEAEVITPIYIPSASGVFWISGVTILKSNKELESVFIVDTDTGGTLLAVYWWINHNWYEQNDDEVFSVINDSRDNIFPFDWRYNVKLEKDIYHD